MMFQTSQTEVQRNEMLGFNDWYDLMQKGHGMPWMGDRPEVLNQPIDMPDTSAIFDPVMRHCIGRRFFGVDNGSLGLGPAIMEEGDIVCVLFGGVMRYILRPSEEGRYLFLGGCNIRDVMNGEVVENWKRDRGGDERFSLY